MRGLVVAAVLMCSVAAWSEQPNPADYPLTAHVTRSYFILEGSGLHQDTLQVLDVLINGKKLQLEAEPIKVSKSYYGLISIGDYRAKLTVNREKGSYLTFQKYEILFPDQHTKSFEVVGKSE